MTNAELEALALSLEVALRSVLLSLPIAIATAWLLTRRRFAGRTLLDAFVHLPMVLPPVMVGYVLLLLFGQARQRHGEPARSAAGVGTGSGPRSAAGGGVRDGPPAGREEGGGNRPLYGRDGGRG